jgi:hypothetical protein
MATVKENLIAARALIDMPEKWGKGSYQEGGCHCAIGAVLKVQGLLGISCFAGDEENALKAALPTLDMVEHFNDHPFTTHADIMALFDRAIAAQDGAP